MQTVPPANYIHGTQYLVPLHVPDWCGITWTGVAAGHPAWALALPLDGNCSEEEEEGGPLSLASTGREHTSEPSLGGKKPEDEKLKVPPTTPS